MQRIEIDFAKNTLNGLRVVSISYYGGAVSIDTEDGNSWEVAKCSMEEYLDDTWVKYLQPAPAPVVTPESPASPKQRKRRPIPRAARWPANMRAKRR